MALGSKYLLLAEDYRDRSRIGRWLRCLYFNKFGTLDLHSHTRWRAVRKILPFEANCALDVGCGSGIITFEVAHVITSLRRVIGVDIDQDSINIANKVARMLGFSSCAFDFIKHDISVGLPFDSKTFDLVLLIDVVEHIHEDVFLISEVSRVLKPGGYIVISVPTPNYPRFFGYEFHHEIGHVRDGYWLEDLEKMFNSYSITISAASYYTYIPSSVICGMFYKWLRKNMMIAAALSPILRIVSLIDDLWPWRDGKFASSLAVQGVKRK